MVTAVHDADRLLASDLDAEFLELVCADGELLDAEFEAIVAGMEPPPRTPPVPPGAHDRGRRATPVAQRSRANRTLPQGRPPTAGRERSPPPRWRRRRPTS
ncbi:MAG TPA: hypothetical protein VFP73_07100 [Terrabacter sp.]|nr:hypothetical protein [Terrabacter sp.]